MAQVMQWLPAICNYMRKVRLKYQHVPPTLCPLVILYSQEKSRNVKEQTVFIWLYIVCACVLDSYLIFFVFKLAVNNGKMAFTC